MKIKITTAIELVKYYELRYNTQFEISKLYSLFPTENEYGFTNSWPFLNDGGVYLVLDENMDVIYVGKADVFGKRLYDHFREDENGRCIVRESGWKNSPRYIVNIKVPSERLYENLSLEGYLIRTLDPDDNYLGRNRIYCHYFLPKK